HEGCEEQDNEQRRKNTQRPRDPEMRELRIAVIALRDEIAGYYEKDGDADHTKIDSTEQGDERLVMDIARRHRPGVRDEHSGCSEHSQKIEVIIPSRADIGESGEIH